MIARQITWWNKDDKRILACDAKCEKAWGINRRPKVSMSEDEDDYAYLTDDELGTAPEDPGTAEGFESKPTCPEQRLNRWCTRECERSVMVLPNTEFHLPEFHKRVGNLREYVDD